MVRIVALPSADAPVAVTATSAAASNMRRITVTSWLRFTSRRCKRGSTERAVVERRAATIEVALCPRGRQADGERDVRIALDQLPPHALADLLRARHHVALVDRQHAAVTHEPAAIHHRRRDVRGLAV